MHQHEGECVYEQAIWKEEVEYLALCELLGLCG